jgi:hypothetical protein
VTSASSLSGGKGTALGDRTCRLTKVLMPSTETARSGFAYAGRGTRVRRFSPIQIWFDTRRVPVRLVAHRTALVEKRA